MRIEIPEPSLVVLVGPSGCGKSTFAQRHFRPTEVLSSDSCRALVCDDETDQAASIDAFAVLHCILAKRLAHGRLTVVDATHVQPDSRKPLLALARQYHVVPVAIAFNLSEELCLARDQQRAGRSVGARVIHTHHELLGRALERLEREGFRHVHVFTAAEEVDAAEVVRVPLSVDRRQERGPFDLIGDVHGCLAELKELLAKLGYEIGDGEVRPPPGRKAVFVGDLVDRGPDTPGVLRLVMSMVRAGTALCVQGNHDRKLARKLSGHEIKVNPGLAAALEQFAHEPPEFRELAWQFLDGLESHYVLDLGRLVVAHAGLKEELQGRASPRVHEFALYGETTGETDETGLPVRLNWAGDYRGRAKVVYGHTPVDQPQWLHNTICLDTGCVFGGRLTALRYPELELVSVPAARTYMVPPRPFRPSDGQPVPPSNDLLNANDFLGKRLVTTRLHPPILVREEPMLAALAELNRAGADPRWLIGLPFADPPVEPSARPECLEHPDEAFRFYEQAGVARIVAEPIVAGVPVMMVVCRDEATARDRFGVGSETGVIYTQTGSRYFGNSAREAEFLATVRTALSTANVWDEFRTGWACLSAVLQAPLLDAAAELRLAPLALLATEGQAHADRPALWHRDHLAALSHARPELFLPVPVREAHLADQAARADVARWWEELTAVGGAGLTIRPAEVVPAGRGRGGRVPPALAVRGRDYLRTVYGPEYTQPDQLAQLRKCDRGEQQALAARQFALSVEALERFVRREPLRAVHECVLVALALGRS